jgi:hypothetical protein
LKFLPSLPLKYSAASADEETNDKSLLEYQKNETPFKELELLANKLIKAINILKKYL